MSEYRLKRIENILREIIGNLIVQNKIKDPGVSSLISISRIEVSKNVAYAKIFISGFENSETTKNSVDGLNRASGFIRNLVGKKIKTRNTPQLKFFYDDSIEHSFYINQLIEDQKK